MHKQMTQDQFVELLTNWLRANKQFSANLQISPDTELLGSGILDSFDFLDLIVHLESKLAAKIDLSVADPNQFSTVGGLWNLAMSAYGSGAEQRGTDRGKVLPAEAGI
jgi:acyl carrier protein